MHSKNIVITGTPLQEARKAIILLHGRGADAEDILGLATHLNVKDYALFAPQATGNAWYPYSFLMPPKQNEPWLSSALELVGNIVDDIKAGGISAGNIYFAGFSQGACLTLEFVTRNAQRFGGVAAFTGGLIGDTIYPENYAGDFDGTPIFIGTSNPDPHVPLRRVNDTAELLTTMHAKVTKKVYDNMGHTINQDEINLANSLVFG